MGPKTFHKSSVIFEIFHKKNYASFLTFFAVIFIIRVIFNFRVIVIFGIIFIFICGVLLIFLIVFICREFFGAVFISEIIFLLVSFSFSGLSLFFLLSSFLRSSTFLGHLFGLIFIFKFVNF